MKVSKCGKQSLADKRRTVSRHDKRKFVARRHRQFLAHIWKRGFQQHSYKCGFLVCIRPSLLEIIVRYGYERGSGRAKNYHFRKTQELTNIVVGSILEVQNNDCVKLSHVLIFRRQASLIKSGIRSFPSCSEQYTWMKSTSSRTPFHVLLVRPRTNHRQHETTDLTQSLTQKIGSQANLSTPSGISIQETLPRSSCKKVQTSISHTEEVWSNPEHNTPCDTDAEGNLDASELKSLQDTQGTEASLLKVKPMATSRETGYSIMIGRNQGSRVRVKPWQLVKYSVTRPGVNASGPSVPNCKEFTQRRNHLDSYLMQLPERERHCRSRCVNRDFSSP